MQSQRIATEPFRLRCFGDFHYSQDVALEVSPAKLSLALVVLQVSGTSVAAKDSREYLAEQLNQHFGPARQSNLIEDKTGGNQSPEPAFISAGPITRFVTV